ncbi:MAG: sugar phosphate isomerase/epimerase [Eubacteriales bacterium]|nr:sugar phosphate isomerase/epimerase [Eubacteriales bacterium]
MNIGCSIIPGEAATARDCGFAYVELAGKVVHSMDETAFEKLCKELTQASVPCLGFNAYCPKEIVIAGPGYSEANAEAYARELLPRAKALGVKLVGIGSPFSRILPTGFDPALADEQALRFFTATGHVFGEAGIRVCIEALAPCYCNYLNRVEDADALAQAVALPNVGVVADFYNMEHVGQADRELGSLLPRLFHVHISDDDGTPTRRDFLKPERAAFHQQRIRRLLDSGYQGNLTVEVDLPVTKEKAVSTFSILEQFVDN